MANCYVDFTESTGALTGTWTWTNASTTVNAAGLDGNAVAELSAGNYVRMSDGTEWYKVASITDDDNFELAINFQQATHTDDAGASLYNSEDGSTEPENYPDAGHEAFCHLNQATTDNARTAGDIIYVRANQTHVYAGVDIAMDEDGTANAYISIQGCDDGDNDPWSDASAVKVILDFGSTAKALRPNSDQFWKIANLAVKGGAWGYGVLYVTQSEGLIVEDCDFYDNGTAASHYAIRIETNGSAYITNCTFTNNYGVHVWAKHAERLYISGCTFNGDTVGGGNSTDTGLYVAGCLAYIKDCSFGDTDAHDTVDISVEWGSMVYGRNVKLASPTEVSIGSAASGGGQVILEDDEQTHYAFRCWFWNGNISRSAVVERSGSGGTAWSMLVEPNSNCGAEQALYGIGDWLRGIPIYLDGTEQTITAYAWAVDWTGMPDVDEFVVEIEHYQGAADWEIDATSDTFAANGQWESFAITLTPGAAGVAYLRIYLKDYEAGDQRMIYIDPKPIIS